MTCPDCERYKESARNWRHKAYELSGHPLPWEGGDTWVGLTEDEYEAIRAAGGFGKGSLRFKNIFEAIESRLREKNS